MRQHIGAVGFHIIMNKDPLSRMLPPVMVNAAAFLEAARRTRPGAIAVGVLLGGASSAWMGLTFRDYVASAASAGGAPVAAAPTSADGGALEITLEEVEKHSTPDDLWLAVDGQVYDLTK
jgi:hypothetical protein